MNSVNARGTWLTSKFCIPHLENSAKKGRNPHILNLSPPLDMSEHWFAPHTAYTMAKCDTHGPIATVLFSFLSFPFLI